MSFAADVKRSFSLLSNPSKETSRKLSVSGALKFYYEATLIPFALLLVFGYLSLRFGAVLHNVGFMLLITRFMPALELNKALVIFAALYLWVLAPIGFFVNAAIYQIVGKHFLKLFKGNYERTFNALVFGSLPLILFFWVLFIPVLSIIAFIVLPVWEIVVLIIALASQQRITRLQSLATVLVIVVFALLILFLAFSSFRIAYNLGPLIYRRGLI